ncbi:hypothetical protein Ahy_A01g000170 isoform A [Arachis hypogaea]|uniref:Uncharacterized protein n=1 Tax=Arachis hypogaea TaxID=3818 RepID=A0A445EJV3_ARAHY|nr:hypothetical protein Ahy_A01g000170 isoform A [Arachis hypogaea]
MSNSTDRISDTPLNVEELVQLGTTYRELRKEKDVLERSQTQGFQLIRIMEQHGKSLLEAHKEDKKTIERLEKELLNCSQEIDFLQDHLSSRNTEVNNLEARVLALEMKLEEMEYLQEEVFSLREELQNSNSKQASLIHELETKEVELEKSALFIEKLEESISSLALESQLEIESMKLDMMALEQGLFEAKKFQDETLEENNRMGRLVDELQFAFEDAQKNIISLDEENKDLRKKLETTTMNTRMFSQKVEEWLENKEISQIKKQSSLSSLPCNSTISEDHLWRSIGSTPWKIDNNHLKGKMEMLRQIQEYEFLVNKLKEELRVEKLKAKEEAEDLTQEMAELRYQLTNLLEEECKRRACIEQASLQRIAELEAQLQRQLKIH